MSLYALDGVCHNAEPGTYGHECGKPAKWLGTDRNGFTSGFCDDCKVDGYEARRMTDWRSAGNPWRVEQWRDGGSFRGWTVVRDLGSDKGQSFAATIEAQAGPVQSWRLRSAAQTLAVDLNRREMA